MAYSSGFSPHPRISYANPAPTSAQSFAEYLDIALAEPSDPREIAARLDEALPQGFRISHIVETRRPKLAELLEASRWWIALGDLDEALLRAAVARLLDAPAVRAQRVGRSGGRVVDVRPAILAMSVNQWPAQWTSAPQGPAVAVTLRHLVPLVRPDDIVAALRVLCPGLGGDHPGLFTRESQGPLAGDGVIADPLADPRADCATLAPDGPEMSDTSGTCRTRGI